MGNFTKCSEIGEENILKSDRKIHLTILSKWYKVVNRQALTK